MAGFLLVPLTTIVLALMMSATGWAMGVCASVRCLRGRRLEVWIGRAFLGTACWMLLFGFCSHLGLSVRDVRWPFACGFLAVVICACYFGPPLPVRVRVPSGPTILYWFACGVVLLLISWPIVRCAAVWPFNDTLVYCSISRWLQDHAFAQLIAIDPDLPVTRYVNEFQTQHWRMGSTFLLALLVGYSGLDPLLAFPVLMGWGMMLNVGGIFLLARWGLRLNRWFAAGASLCAATALNPLWTSIHQGFQPQLFGTAFFLTSLSLLVRAGRSAFWTRGNALFLAVEIASLVSAYSEMTPLLTMTGLSYCIWMLVRSKDRSHWLRFAGWTVFFLALAGNVEWWRAWQALRNAAGVVVGYPIPWSDFEYVGFAIGQLHYHHRPELMDQRGLIIVVACALLLLGMLVTLRERRAWPITAALLSFVLFVLYFRFMAHDPRTGELGHRWSLFKLAKWAFPLLLVLQFAGLALLARRLRLRPALGVIPGVLALAMSYTYHREYNQWAGQAMLTATGSANPLDEWRKLNASLDRRGVTTIYLEHPDGGRVPYILMPYVMYPKRFVNGWKGCDLEEVRASNPVSVPAGAIVLSLGDVGDRLPGGVSICEKPR